jgi:hypothetical protein
VPNISYMALLVAILASICLAWRLSLSPRPPGLPQWRQRLMFLGLLANVVSLAIFLSVSLGPLIMRSWSPDIHNYRLSLPLTLAGIALGAFGRRVPRILVILNGLVLTFLWLSLAASTL